MVLDQQNQYPLEFVRNASPWAPPTRRPAAAKAAGAAYLFVFYQAHRVVLVTPESENRWSRDAQVRVMASIFPVTSGSEFLFPSN